MERINFERLEFFEKRINEIFNQVTEENNLSLEDLAIKMLQLKLNVNYRSLELLLHCARAKRNNELELEGPVMVLKLIRK